MKGHLSEVTEGDQKMYWKERWESERNETKEKLQIIGNK